jgi:hypothetical protein
MSEEDYNPKARKEIRRQKSKKKSSPKDYDDDFCDQNRIQKELRKKRLEVDEEEWEDWERYYNR